MLFLVFCKWMDEQRIMAVNLQYCQQSSAIYAFVSSP
jgi:hypothetical protein